MLRRYTLVTDHDGKTAELQKGLTHLSLVFYVANEN